MSKHAGFVELHTDYCVINAVTPLLLNFTCINNSNMQKCCYTVIYTHFIKVIFSAIALLLNLPWLIQQQVTENAECHGEAALSALRLWPPGFISCCG